jgi:hypothetical protein
MAEEVGRVVRTVRERSVELPHLEAWPLPDRCCDRRDGERLAVLPRPNSSLGTQRDAPPAPHRLSEVAGALGEGRATRPPGPERRGSDTSPDTSVDKFVDTTMDR